MSSLLFTKAAHVYPKWKIEEQLLSLQMQVCLVLAITSFHLVHCHISSKGNYRSEKEK